MLKLKDRPVTVAAITKTGADTDVKLCLELTDGETGAIPGYGKALMIALDCYRGLVEGLTGKKANRNRFTARVILPFLEGSFTLEERPTEHETPCVPIRFTGKPKNSVDFSILGNAEKNGVGCLTVTIPARLSKEQIGSIASLVDVDHVFISSEQPQGELDFGAETEEGELAL